MTTRTLGSAPNAEREKSRSKLKLSRMEEKIEINAWKAYSDWFRKNWFTMLAIVIIMAMVLVDTATVTKQKMRLVNDCNKHWRNMLESRYPEAVEEGGWMYVDLDEKSYAEAVYEDMYGNETFDKD